MPDNPAVTRISCLACVKEAQKSLTGDHDSSAEFDGGDRAVVDAYGDRAWIDPECFGGVFPSDHDAARLAQRVDGD